jgi:hypothetical protein
VCFISIYLVFILYRILSTHVLVVSPGAKHWPSNVRGFNALDALSTCASLHTSLLFTCIFFGCVQLLF